MARAGPSTQKAHMSTQQPEALRLAEILELGSRQFNKEASTELRRLHAINAEMVEALKLADYRLNDLGLHPDGQTRSAVISALAKAEGR